MNKVKLMMLLMVLVAPACGMPNDQVIMEVKHCRDAGLHPDVVVDSIGHRVMRVDCVMYD